MSQTSWLFSGFLNVALSSIVQSRNVCLKNKGILWPVYCLAQFFCYFYCSLLSRKFNLAFAQAPTFLNCRTCLVSFLCRHKPLVTIICSFNYYALSPKPGLLESNYLHFLACLLLWRIDKAMIVVSIL